jgi:hypothetical protein
LIAATFFKATEKPLAFALIGAAFLVYVGLDGVYGAPVHIYTAPEYHAFSRLNAMSAGTLCVFVGLIASGLISQISSRR